MEEPLPVRRTPLARFRELPLAARIRAAVAFVIPVIIAVGWLLFISAPAAFPTDRLIEVRADEPVSILADSLQKEEVIRSAFFFHAWMRITGSDREVHAGTYYFSKRLNLFSVSERITKGERGIESLRVTLTEGMTAREMADTLAATLPDFSAEAFTLIATPYEGYLFPDTYFVDPGTTPEQVLERMRTNFIEKTKDIASDPEFDRIVIMASIIEKEADNAEDRRMVSAILWNRIELGMPLQVDAVFGYILGRSGYAPTGDDLEIDSPYNTYLNRDLPPGPIANPGRDALEAARTPTWNPYLYYLTGRDGRMYYAETFEEHKTNRQLYLD